MLRRPHLEFPLSERHHLQPGKIVPGAMPGNMAMARKYGYGQCQGIWLWQYSVPPQELFTCVWWFDFDCDTAEDFYALNEVSLVCCVQMQCVLCTTSVPVFLCSMFPFSVFPSSRFPAFPSFHVTCSGVPGFCATMLLCS